MLWVLLACIAGWTITAAALIRVVAGMQRQHGRREDLLLNQLLHTVGTPWQPAPSNTSEPAEREPRTWTATPEQEPVY